MITGKNIGYIRVSTADQNTVRQLEGVALDRVFEDKASGGTTNRPAWKECLAFIREGDVLHVHSIDRLARNLQDLLSILTAMTASGITVRFHKEGLEFNGQDSPFQRLQLQIIGAVAEFERAMIKERQREGIAIAKSAGKYRGRKPSLDSAQIAEIRRRLKSGEKVAALAREYGVSRQTLYESLRR
ncbi:recombinase family protein [Nitratidesulfovibrio vulgaris]|uniref:recombinase family protein n=1 Tax=Nitratidesulfovibrio vulgaris TaxID=881 RepID=UPI003FD74B7D